MPIFHEPDDTRPQSPPLHSLHSLQPQPSSHLPHSWKPGNVFSFEGPPLDGTRAGPAIPSITNPEPAQASSPARATKPTLRDRVGLIERLKRAKSPPSQRNDHQDQSPVPRPASREAPQTPLLSHSYYISQRPSTPDPLRDNATAGLEIARPRSALHSGDFSEKKDNAHHDQPTSVVPLATSPVVPWHHSFPIAAQPQSRAQSPYGFPQPPSLEQPTFVRSRATSQSSSLSSFAFLPPTSPLVQQSNNTDLDFSSRPSSRQSSQSPERSNRRHTFTPRSLGAYRSSDMVASLSDTPAARHMKKTTSMPYQAHQPRRSLTSFNHFQPHSSPQTPWLRSRRPSFSDSSPLHHAPMVGSYEESILRGRMSTTPSRPLNFIAKIGVLGRGECKANLKCPPHVAVPFPAVFYSYKNGNGRLSDDSPSPYVGLVDLENSLASQEGSSETSQRRRRRTAAEPSHEKRDNRFEKEQEEQSNARDTIRRKEKKKRRSTSPKAPPGGSYRIPQQGQLQIVIKNPNKTAVKLFLVPYDLSDMEPGQKTFIRQRSYSAGPIIDMPLASRKNLGTDCPEAALSHSDDPNDRPILRYLIHLHICCPSKGRYYLYKSIRVVFANRVPDGKEKLRNEIQLPEPRYSTYKATRDSLASQTPSSAAAQLLADKAMRRRSAGMSLSHHSHERTQVHGLKHRPQLPPPAVEFTGGPSHHTNFPSPVADMGPIPFPLGRIPSIPSRPLSRDVMDVDSVDPFRSPVGPRSPPPSQFPNTPTTTSEMTSFEKLNKGDIGYGGNAFRGIGGSPSSPGAGLLARRLRGLDVEQDDDPLT